MGKLKEVRTYRTDQRGNIEVMTGGEPYSVSTERQASASQDYLHLPFAQLIGYNRPSLSNGHLRLGIWHCVVEWPSPHEGEREK